MPCLYETLVRISLTTRRAVIIGIPVPTKSPRVLVNSDNTSILRIFPQTGRLKTIFETTSAPFSVLAYKRRPYILPTNVKATSHQNFWKKEERAIMILVGRGSSVPISAYSPVNLGTTNIIIKIITTTITQTTIAG